MASLIPDTVPLTRTSLAEAAYQRLLEAILSGQLSSGTELSEVALAAELGVSRTPVHEALLWLLSDGLVEPLANRQVRVARFSRPEIVEIYEMRLLLEPAAAERAAQQFDCDKLADLSGAAERLAGHGDSPQWAARAIELDVRFHDEIAAASGNRRLQAEIRKYRHLVRAFCRLSAGAENLREALEEHRRILAALSARDSEGARKQMAAHIAARLEAVLREIDSQDKAGNSAEHGH